MFQNRRDPAAATILQPMRRGTAYLLVAILLALVTSVVVQLVLNR